MIIYLFNLMFSIIISFISDKYNLKKLFFLIGGIWVIIIGFQFDVGTDYFSYLKIFEDSSKVIKYFYTKEYIFYYFVVELQKIFKNGQYFFAIIAFLEVALFYMILVKSKIKKYNYFIILFLTVCTVFHNQMNGIRQYFVIYLFTLSILYYVNNNKGKSFINFIMGRGIHKSIVILFPFYFFINKIKKITKIEGYVLLISSIIILIFFPVMEFVKLILVHSSYYYYYSYIEGSLFQRLEIKYILSKVIYLPLYFLSLYNKKKFSMSVEEKYLYNIGIFSYFLKIITLQNMMMTRIGDYFTILSLYPLYYYLVYLKEENKRKRYLYLSFVLVIYIYKIISFYKYSSYFIVQSI